MKCSLKHVYMVPDHMVNTSDLIYDTYAHKPLMYGPEKYAIYLKCV